MVETAAGGMLRVQDVQSRASCNTPEDRFIVQYTAVYVYCHRDTLIGIGCDQVLLAVTFRKEAAFAMAMH